MRALLILPLVGSLFAAEYRAPAGDRPTIPRPGAISVLPGGRMIQAFGRQYGTGPGPFGVAVSPNGRYAVTANGGPQEFGLSILEKDDRGRYRIEHMVAPKEGSDEGMENSWRSVFMGIAFVDNDDLIVSEGESGNIRRIYLHNRKKLEIFAINQDTAQDSYTGDLAYDPNRRLLYVLDQANFRLVTLDVHARKALSSLQVGRLPFAIDLSPDGKRVFITHIGMFEYQRISGADVGRTRETGLPFPAFGFPSPDSVNGVRRETLLGEATVPGLGNAISETANALGVVNLEDPSKPRVEAYIHTGKPIGDGRMGGSSPSGVLATAERVYVANAHNDSISVIDQSTWKVTQEIEIRIPGLESLRGVMPIGLAYHQASGWLLVAEAGINAIGVIDTASMEVIGHIPAAWFPSQVVVDRDTVYVVNTKGHGTGASANRMVGFRDGFGDPIHRGAITTFPIPAAEDLPRLTRRVMQLNGFVPQQVAPSSFPPEIKNVVLIVKESRSFDEVFGDVEEASNGPVDAAPMLARFGRFGSAGEAGGGFQRRFSLRGVNVTPNHHAMAERWAFSDNFYADAETSVEGHHWLAGVPPNAWTVSSLVAAYGGRKQYRPTTMAPGRLMFADRSSSVHPEEIPESGTLWHHLERYGISFRNFGEGFELAGVQRGENLEPTGARFLTNVAMPDSLFRNTSRDYPGYNTNITDQYRAGQFINDIEKQYRKPGKELPRFIYVHLPNDDMADARPNEGYPFTASFVADNDYAMGRIVEYLSKTPWWKNMAIFVTEDDASGGVDHVDSHRTILLAASPYAKINYVSHRNVSFPGLLKTIFGIFNLPPLNLFDATATDLADCFTDEPNFTPYEARPIREELFVPETDE